MKKSILNKVTIARQIVASLFLVSLLSAGEANAQSQTNVKGKLNEYLGAHLAQGTFNGTVLVTQKGQTIYNQAFGMADYEKQLPNSGESIKYRIGSVTKPFTAVLVMQLQEKGKLNVQDKVSKYLPDFPNGDKITLHHLLSNTSGLPDFVNYFKTIDVTAPATTYDILNLIKDKPLEFEPGNKWNYSSTGFVVLAQVIEKVTGNPYEKVLAKQILNPLRMTATGLESGKPVANLAKGYNHDGIDRKLAKPINMSWCHAAGAMYSTAADLAKFDAALYNNSVLTPASQKLMFTPVLKNYGYGWAIDSVSKQLRISHSGAINGFKANFIRLPEQEITITILSNYESPQVNGPISRDVTAIVLGDNYEVPIVRSIVTLSDDQLAKYVGEYQVAPKMKFRIFIEEGQLFAEAPGQDKFAIFPEAEDKFFVKVAPAIVTFEKDTDGKITKMLMHHGGRSMPAARLN